MRIGFILFCVVIFLSGCSDSWVEFGAKLTQTSEPAQITKTVLEYWKNGDYETPKQLWVKEDLEDYSYISDIDSYKVVYEIPLPYHYRVIMQVKVKANNGIIEKKLYLFNFFDIEKNRPPTNREWRIYLVEEAEKSGFLSYLPKGKTHMTKQKYHGQDQSGVLRSVE